jgi:hypothetical protein
MRAMYLANYFVAGCIAFSLLGWVASLHPIAFRADLCFWQQSRFAGVLSWLLDFSEQAAENFRGKTCKPCWQSWFGDASGLGVFLCT